MDVKGKGGWGLPALVALGAFAYYLTTLRISADPQHRRQSILRRLYDGTSPRTLLKDGYTRAELLDAGVPPASLSLNRSESSSASPPEVVRREQSDVFADPPDCGVLTRVFGSFVHISHTVQTASDALVCGLRGRSASTSLADTKAAVADGGNADDAVSALTAPRAVEGCGSCALYSSSICIAPSLLRHHSLEAAAAAVSVESTSPERRRSRSPGGALPVHLAALSAAVTRGYTEESSSYRYPLEVLRFLHEDGSRLSLMAESCTFVAAGSSSSGMGTDAYVQSSLARAEAAADAAKTYFKVKLNTAARNIATTVMESYVNAHVGPLPVILAAFYLVAHDVAYTIQLQTHTGAYEERLADLLYTAQSARLSGRDSVTLPHSSTGGCNVCVLHVEGVEETYAVELPVNLVAHVPETSAERTRCRLILTPCSGDGGNGYPSAVVEVHARGSLDPSPNPRDARTLYDDMHVVITLTTAPNERGISWVTSLEQVTARRASLGVTVPAAAIPSYAFVSPLLTLPLPPPEEFYTTVCEHPHDAFVTLFIATDSSSTADLFEVELRCVSDLHHDDLDAFLAALGSLFLTLSHPHHTINAAGQRVFAMEGLAAALAETSVRVYGVQLVTGSWLVMRWLYADSAIFPRALERYRRGLTEEVLCCGAR